LGRRRTGDPLLRIYEGCARAIVGSVPGANIFKLHRDTPQISYLRYPTFERDPHPALTGALVVSLRSFELQWRDYSGTKNPPILHRKEEFVGQSHPHRDRFERLTRQEERVGLFREPSRIGTLSGWQAALAEAGVALRGHRVISSKI
jgi:DNA phosphorothioation-associated putative methyltransferase